MEFCEIMGQKGAETTSQREIKCSKTKKRRTRPKPRPHRLGHGLGCLEAAPREKPQCDESVSLDFAGIKSLLWRESVFIQGMAVRIAWAEVEWSMWNMWWEKATMNPQSRH